MDVDGRSVEDEGDPPKICLLPLEFCPCLGLVYTTLCMVATGLAAAVFALGL